MPRWINGFENLPLHSKLEKLKTRIAEIQKDSKALEFENAETLERIAEVLDFLSLRLKRVNPSLVATGTIDAISRFVDSITDQLNPDNAEPLEQRIGNATEYADHILTQIPNLHSPQTPKEVDGMTAAVSSFHSTVRESLDKFAGERNNLAHSYDGLVTRMETIIAEINNQKGRLDTAIAEFQSQFSNSEAARREEFTKAESNRVEQAAQIRATIDEVLSKFRNESIQLEEARNTKFLEMQNVWLQGYAELNVEEKTSFDAMLSDAQKRTNLSIEQIVRSTTDLISEINIHREKAEAIVHVIGNTGMVGGYQRVANEEKETAVTWRRVALIAMVGLIGFGIYAFWSSTHTTFNWGIFSSRIFAALTFGVLAAYAARQSEKHREIERTFRRVELELASIDPYIVHLPEDVQIGIKSKLVERLFGQIEPTSNEMKEKALNTTGTTADVLKPLLDILKTTIEQLTKKQ